MDNPLHLARRFWTSATAKEPTPAEVDWVKRHLGDGEFVLWNRMSVPDQAHSIEVAQRVLVSLGYAHQEAMAAAILHDVGKVESGLGTPMRVLATVVWIVLPSKMAYAMAERRGVPGRIARYHLHPDIGARLCCEAGSSPLVSSWAAEHHLGSDSWSVPDDLATVLKDCDET